MRLLPDTLSATPAITKDMARVAISGLIFRYATIKPLTMPKPSATSNATPMAISGE